MIWMCYHLFSLSQCHILRDYWQIREMTFKHRMVEYGTRSMIYKEWSKWPEIFNWGNEKWVAKRESQLGSSTNIGVLLSMGLNKSAILCVVFGSLSRQDWRRGEGGNCFLPVVGAMCKITVLFGGMFKTTVLWVNKPAPTTPRELAGMEQPPQ